MVEDFGWRPATRRVQGMGAEPPATSSSAKRVGVGASRRRIRGAVERSPVGFGLGTSARGGASAAGTGPAFERGFRRMWMRLSNTAKKVSRHEGRVASASAKAHWADWTGDIPGGGGRPQGEVTKRRAGGQVKICVSEGRECEFYGNYKKSLRGAGGRAVLEGGRSPPLPCIRGHSRRFVVIRVPIFFNANGRK